MVSWNIISIWNWARSPLIGKSYTADNLSLSLFVWKQDESEVTSDEENCLTQDEIQSFVENNKSFMSNRNRYRQHLKDRFTKYCRSNEQSKSVCSAEWLPTTSVN